MLHDTAILLGTKNRPAYYNEYLNTLLSMSKKLCPKRKLKRSKKICKVNSLSLPTGSMKMLDVKVEGIMYQSLIDTGSIHCLMSVESFQKLGLTCFKPISMLMKVAVSSIKNNIIGSINLSIELATNGSNPFVHKLSFLFAHHINGYVMILGADFLLNPLHVMAITPYTFMLYEKDRTVCAPFVSKNLTNKYALTSNCKAFTLPVGEAADIKIKCHSDVIRGNLEKFTPLVTFLSKGLLFEKIFKEKIANNCTLSLRNVGMHRVEIDLNCPVGILEMSENPEEPPCFLMIPYCLLCVIFLRQTPHQRVRKT
jgi:hypothetical protein